MQEVILLMEVLLAPKLRGLILPRGSALHVGISGIGSLTNGFYINIQGGYY